MSGKTISSPQGPQQRTFQLLLNLGAMLCVPSLGTGSFSMALSPWDPLRSLLSLFSWIHKPHWSYPIWLQHVWDFRLTLFSEAGIVCPSALWGKLFPGRQRANVGGWVKQTAQLQGTVVKKMKPASQLSVFYQCKCWSPFFKPSRDPKRGGEGCVSGNFTRQKMVLQLEMQLTRSKKLQELGEGHRKVKRKEGGGWRGSDGIFQAL